MNPGPVEEGAKVATSVVDALRSQPLSLALIVLNVVFILFTGWLAHTVSVRTGQQLEAKDQLITKLIEQCPGGGKAVFEHGVLQ